MAVSRHLGFYRIGYSAIRSAFPENPSLEPNMEWIGCTVCKIFAFKLYCDLETGVRGHSRSSKMTPFDSVHMVSYYRPILTLCLKCTVFEIWRHIGRKSPEKHTHSHLARSFGVTPCEFFDDSYLARNYTVSQKNDTDVTRYRFNPHQPISVISLDNKFLK